MSDIATPRGVLSFARALLAVFLAFLLAACGGGGGGSGGGSSASGGGSFRVALDRSTVSFTFLEGSPSAGQTIVATVQGNVPDPIYVGAVLEGNALESYIPTQFTSNGAQFQLRPKNMPPGIYTGRVLVYACSDQFCTNPIGGTPLAVNYRVEVRSALKVSPAGGLWMDVTSGNTGASSFTVQLPAGADRFTATVASGSEWLVLGAANGLEQPVGARSMPPGYYYGEIRVQAQDQIVPVHVRYAVDVPNTGYRDLGAAPTSLTFGAVENTAAPAQQLNVTLASWMGARGELQYEIQPVSGLSGWLSLRPNATGYEVTASAVGLAKGSYSANLRIFHPQRSYDPVVVPVSFTIGQGLVQPAGRQLKVTATTTEVQLAGSAAIDLASGPPVNWTATVNRPWLRLTRSSGASGTPVAYAVDLPQLAAMANFSADTATVTVTPAAAGMTPVSFDIALTKEIPELHFAGPYLVVAGKAAQVRLRGRGLVADAPLSTYLDNGGTNPTSVVRVSDSQLLMQLPGLAAGSYVLRFKNALGFTPDQVRIQAVAPRTYAAAAVATGGHPMTMVYDAAREAVFMADMEAQKLVRLKHDGTGGWTRSTVPFAGGVRNLGMAPDGSSLVVASNAVSLVDPDTLQTTFQVGSGMVFSPTFNYLSFGIPATNDGRSWLAVGDYWNELTYFDHRTRSLVVLEPGHEHWYHGGPWMVASGDGERMVLVQSASISPRPPVLYYDASNPVLKSNPAGLEYSYEMSLSGSGDRLAIYQDTPNVYDADFHLIGRVVLPTPYSSIASMVMSPDGTRLYVLTYRWYASASELPIVVTYDTSVSPAVGSDLPVVGQFTITQRPSCVDPNGSNCGYQARGTISPDGRTLFYAGDKYFVVAPIPAESAQTSGAATTSSRATRQNASSRTFYLWRPQP